MSDGGTCEECGEDPAPDAEAAELAELHEAEAEDLKRERGMHKYARRDGGES